MAICGGDTLCLQLADARWRKRGEKYRQAAPYLLSADPDIYRYRLHVSADNVWPAPANEKACSGVLTGRARRREMAKMLADPAGGGRGLAYGMYLWRALSHRWLGGVARGMSAICCISIPVVT